SLSRGVRVTVERGSIAYSAVTQPRPELRSHPGTPCSTVAQVSTRVLPSATSTEPSAVCTKPGVSVRGRSWAGVLPPGRKKRAEACIGRLYGNPAFPASPGRGTPGFRMGIRPFPGPERESDRNLLFINRLESLTPVAESRFGTNPSIGPLPQCPGIGH